MKIYKNSSDFMKCPYISQERIFKVIRCQLIVTLLRKCLSMLVDEMKHLNFNESEKSH